MYLVVRKRSVCECCARNFEISDKDEEIQDLTLTGELASFLYNLIQSKGFVDLGGYGGGEITITPKSTPQIRTVIHHGADYLSVTQKEKILKVLSFLDHEPQSYLEYQR